MVLILYCGGAFMLNSLLILSSSLLFLLSGCTSVSEIVEKGNSNNISVVSNDTELIEIQTFGTTDIPIFVYTVNGDLISLEIIEEKIDKNDNLYIQLIDKLKEYKVLNETLNVNSIYLDETNNLILDFDNEFLNQLKSYGTTMEYYTISCIVNSFLKSFELKGVQILVDGEFFETGHNIYDTVFTSIME